MQPIHVTKDIRAQKARGVVVVINESLGALRLQVTAWHDVAFFGLGNNRGGNNREFFSAGHHAEDDWVRLSAEEGK